MMKTLFVLVEEWNEQDSYSSQIVGVTDSKAWAHAFGAIDQFQSGPEEKTLEIVTLNVLDGKLLSRIEEWLDPKRNPLCTCGHRKLHHRTRRSRRYNYQAKPGEGNCKWNISHGGKDRRHMCKGFKAAKEQPRIEFEEPRSKIVTAAGLATGWKRYKELFGVEPHGTEKQMAGLMELARDDYWEKLQSDAEKRREEGNFEHGA